MRKPKTSPVERIFQAYQNKDSAQGKVTIDEECCSQSGETEAQYRAKCTDEVSEQGDDAKMSWYEMSDHDEDDTTIPEPVVNHWEKRKRAAEKAEQDAKDFWKESAEIKAETNKANDQMKSNFQAELQKVKDNNEHENSRVKSLFEIELEKIKEQCERQNKTNEEQVQKLVEQQNAANNHFKEVCDKINVDIAAGMKELFGTLSKSIEKQTENFNVVNLATQTSIAEIQGKFIGIDKALALILAGQAKNEKTRGSDEDNAGAKKARGSED